MGYEIPFSKIEKTDNPNIDHVFALALTDLTGNDTMAVKYKKGMREVDHYA